MKVRAFAGIPFSAVGYLVYGSHSDEAVIIDAPLGTSKRVAQAIADENLRPVCVILTHGHWDQFADVGELIAIYRIPVWGHGWDANRFADPSLTMEEGDRLQVRPCTLDRRLSDGERVQVGNLSLVVMHTPGHSPGSICLYAEEAGALFSGDLLLRMGVGSTKMVGGNAQQLEASLRRLASLPDSTVVYPAHSSPTSIRNERWLLDLACASVEC